MSTYLRSITTHLRGHAALATAMAAALLLAYGCGASRDAVGNTPYVWPQPPDEPRIAYVRTFVGETDFPSPLGALGNIIGGNEIKIRLSRPFDLSTDSAGRLYVTDAEQGVFVFDEMQQKVDVFGAKCAVPLEAPRGIACGNGKVYIGLQRSGMVAAVSPDGSFLHYVGKPGTFLNPVDVCYDQKNARVIVVDNGRHQVLVFSEKGDSLMAIGRRGDTDGTFNYPQSAAVDASGNIYIVDAMNFRIQEFSESGVFIRKYGSQGDQFGQFARPKGIAIDSYGHIYVNDAVHQHYQIFDSDFKLLLFVGRFASDNWGFQNPVGISIDARNRIFVADQLNGRIQVFQLLKSD